MKTSYYERNKEKRLAYQKAWRENNPEYSKEWYKNNPDRVKAWQLKNPNAGREWRAEHPDYAKKYYEKNYIVLLLKGAKRRAKNKGLEYDLTLDDIKVPEACPVLGIPLRLSQGKQGPGHNSPSLDRVDNTLGYIKGNVIVISARANMLKKDATIEELRAVLAYVEANEF